MMLFSSCSHILFSLGNESLLLWLLTHVALDSCGCWLMWLLTHMALYSSFPYPSNCVSWLPPLRTHVCAPKAARFHQCWNTTTRKAIQCHRGACLSCASVHVHVFVMTTATSVAWLTTWRHSYRKLLSIVALMGHTQINIFVYSMLCWLAIWFLPDSHVTQQK